MTVLNQLDRFQLALDAVLRVPRLKSIADRATQMLRDTLRRHREYVSEHGQDLPEVREWKWNS
jgi:xylulose-5-phosphate/fructose-6-phosphate phosphoketolase